MSLKTKSIENFKIIEACNNNCESLNVATSRAYYCLFQAIKFILEKDGFNYDDFIRVNCRDGERVYSHGTIRNAFITHLKQTNGVIDPIFRTNLMKMDNLYRKRRKADYEDELISMPEFQRIFRDTAIIYKQLIQLWK